MVPVNRTKQVLVPVTKTRPATRWVTKNVCGPEIVWKTKAILEIPGVTKINKKLPYLINGDIKIKSMHTDTGQTFS